MELISQLRIFLRVSDSGSFTAAAEQMGLPRPTVSLALQQLETRLGTRLLNRTTRRVSLTQDGSALRDRAAALIADSEELEQLFLPAAQALQGRLRVDLPSRIARRQVAPALPDFLARHPGIALELGGSDRHADLVREGIDCALRIGVLEASSLIVRPLGHFRLASCASPHYLAEHGRPQHPMELTRHQAVHYIAPNSGHVIPWSWLDQGRLQTQTLTARIAVSSAETYIACGLAGLGLIQVPAFDVQEHLHSGALVEVLPEWPAPALPVQIVYPHRQYLAPRVRAFADWIAVLLRDHLEDG